MRVSRFVITCVLGSELAGTHRPITAGGFLVTIRRRKRPEKGVMTGSKPGGEDSASGDPLTEEIATDTSGPVTVLGQFYGGEMDRIVNGRLTEYVCPDYTYTTSAASGNSDRIRRY
jgi:hypothetical protein